MVDFEALFSTPRGKEAYSRITETVERYGMAEQIRSGVLLGFSGGADSVLLLCFLLEYRRRCEHFNIVAVHVNHGIRGDEAERDEEFSRCLAASMGVEFVSVYADVPSIAKENGIGIEEAARNVRYSKFQEIILGRKDVETVAVAHNATDNLETVIFNMMRGAGARGVSGIAPVRENVIRPLIELPKPEICELLDGAGIEYVFDSTNASTDYTRNYIRGVVLPTLGRLSECPERSVTRMSQNLRQDTDFIDSYAEDFIAGRSVIASSELLELHPSPFFRVISILASRAGSSVERTHVDKLRELLTTRNFIYDLPGGVRFVCEGGYCSLRTQKDTVGDFSYGVELGINTFLDCDAELWVSLGEKTKISSNIYKISIQARLSSAIIEGELRLRSRREGDSIFYGGHHHKLKKIMCDLKVPRSLRCAIPVLCDDRGVLWVPGLCARDDGVTDGNTVVTLGIGLGEELSEKRFYSLTEFRS